jgi:hypothetical protein
MIDDDEPVDFPPQERIEKSSIIPERYAPTGLTGGAAQIGMCKHAVTTKHFGFIERDEPDGKDIMERLVPQREGIDVRRRRTSILQTGITRVIQVAAQARMRLQRIAVRQVHSMRRDVVNRCPAVRPQIVAWLRGLGSFDRRRTVLGAGTERLRRMLMRQDSGSSARNALRHSGNGPPTFIRAEHSRSICDRESCLPWSGNSDGQRR